MSKINCINCKKEHKETTSNCCWIYCECGTKICGGCGSDKIVDIEENELDLSDGADDNYWCCKECKNCNLRGCGMCI